MGDGGPLTYAVAAKLETRHMADPAGTIGMGSRFDPFVLGSLNDTGSF